MSAIIVDLDHWPIFHMSVDGDQTDADINRVIHAQNQADDRGENFLVFVEVGKFLPVMSHVKKLADRANTNEVSAKLCRGCALVVKSHGARFLISSYILIAPIKYPIEVFSERADALRWLRQVASEADLQLPPKLTPESFKTIDGSN